MLFFPNWLAIFKIIQELLSGMLRPVMSIFLESKTILGSYMYRP